MAWTPGEVQAERYDLSKQISEIHLSGTNFKAYDLGGNVVIEQTGVRADDLPELIGKDAADRLLAQKPKGTLRSLTDEDLKIGGEKLISFYDEMIKNYASKFGKKFNAKVGTTKIDTDFDPKKDDLKQVRWRQVWNLPITPKMKEELLTRGIETFAHGGFIDKPLYERTL